jgi:antitoxin component of RelBE/YafQ-DinJ toxin-antitoxin module
MAGDTSVGRSRRLLTFRLDGDQRRRLKARLAGEGRTMSEVVILGLQNYVAHSARRSGSGSGSRELDAPADAPAAPELDEASEPVSVPGLEGTLGAPAAPEPTPRPREPMPTAGLPTAMGTTVTGTTVVASLSQLTLPAPTAAYLRNLRKSGDSDLLSATLARLHEVGWPLRPLADALGISRQAVQARIRQPVPSAVRSRVPDVPPPSAFPRRRPALASGRRAHLTVKIDHALRSAAHGKAVREGSSLSQVIEKILDYYVRHGLPTGEVRLGDTTPTRPGPRRKRRARGAGLASD